MFRSRVEIGMQDMNHINNNTVNYLTSLIQVPSCPKSNTISLVFLNRLSSAWL